MRIRKNAKLSPLLFSSSFSQGGSVPVETFQTHVCQLNQSPWDVIPFDSDSIQFDADDSFTNGSAGDSFGPVESVASMMDTEDNKPGIIEDVAMMALHDNNHDNQHGKKVVVDNNGYKRLGKNSCCNAMDAKGWPCKNGVKHGQSFCHHHLSLLRSHNNNGTIGSNKKTPVPIPVYTTGVGIGSRRAVMRPRAAASKKGLSSNPNEFYYYSGFGPRWGKRRGDKNGEASMNNSCGENLTMLESDNVNGVAADNVVTSSEIDNEGFDFADDDEEEDCDDDNGKKRMRKPVKERSLKSLM